METNTTIAIDQFRVMTNDVHHYLLVIGGGQSTSRRARVNPGKKVRDPRRRLNPQDENEQY
eukprot:6798364-Pyramimonas_sp.AAC.1